MSLLTDVGKKQKAEKAAAQKEVEKVTLAKEDVELVVIFTESGWILSSL